MADRYCCPHCTKDVTATALLKFRKHNDAAGEECMGTAEFVPEHQLELGPIPVGADPGLPVEGRDLATCLTCNRSLKMMTDGTYPPHDNVIRSGVKCPSGGTPYRAIVTLPDIGDDEFLPPPGKAKASTTPPAYAVSDLRAFGDEIAARMKETFYAYDNRKTSDNRSAQTTLGPSEIGTLCDRRLALSLLQVPAVNPGGDGWAAFVGTCIHAGLADMFLWANGDTGRFAVEVPLEFPNEHVPRGTADLLDRVLFMLDDHKCQGQWSANKLRTSGPSPVYRVQMHMYGYGARLKGERIEYVALVSWPRDKSSLEDLYVHVERYDPQIALDALKRVDDIAARVENVREYPDQLPPLQIGLGFPIDNSDGCSYCPFYAPGDKANQRGCTGKA